MYGNERRHAADLKCSGCETSVHRLRGRTSEHFVMCFLVFTVPSDMQDQ